MLEHWAGEYCGGICMLRQRVRSLLFSLKRATEEDKAIERFYKGSSGGNVEEGLDSVSGGKRKM